jgi:hypothetical protein
MNLLQLFGGSKRGHLYEKQNWVVTTMNAINNNKTQDFIFKSDLDILCQEFNGGSFYGLEYILEEFFQSTTAKSSIPASHSVDWFGLYG